METSAKTAANVSELFMKIGNYYYNFYHYKKKKKSKTITKNSKTTRNK